MTPKKFRPEWARVTDPNGVALLRWTSHAAMQHHFYFTNPTVTSDGRTGFFVSYRSGYPNLFSIDLQSGELTQFSDRVDINPFSPSPHPAQPVVYVSARNQVRAISWQTGEDRPLCELSVARLGNCSLSADGAWLAIGLRHERDCELALVETATGKVEILERAPEIGHIQFCPIDPTKLIYSGTGKQRIWLFDRRTGRSSIVYDQKPGEWIVHESWLGTTGQVLFPHWPHALRVINPDGTALRTVAKLNAWHACANRTGALIVCDTNHPDRGLILLDSQTGAQRVLCQPRATQRGTQWKFTEPAVGAGIDTSILRSATPEKDPPPHPDDPASTYGPQWTHPHPTFTADSKKVIFTSDLDRWSQVYSVEI